MTRSSSATRPVHSDTGGTMLRRLMLGGTLIMLLATSSLARKPVGAHCEFDRQCASRNCRDGGVEVARTVRCGGYLRAPRANGTCNARAAAARGARLAPGTVNDLGNLVVRQGLRAH